MFDCMMLNIYWINISNTASATFKIVEGFNVVGFIDPLRLLSVLHMARPERFKRPTAWFVARNMNYKV